MKNLTKNIGKGSAHAKLILMGEHAVVYGYPAIALPVTILKMNVVLQSAYYGQYIEDNEMRRRLDLMGDDFEGIRLLIVRLLTHFEAEKMPFSLEINSNIPRGRGLGASAALATAITRAFYDFFDAELSNEALSQFVDFSESIVHGKPSGIDAATVTSDKPLLFTKGQDVVPVDVDFKGFLVIGDTGIHGLTSQAIAMVQQK